jgi:hypothetical protein
VRALLQAVLLCFHVQLIAALRTPITKRFAQVLCQNMSTAVAAPELIAAIKEAPEAATPSKKKRSRPTSAAKQEALTHRSSIDYEQLHSLLVDKYGSPPAPRSSGDSLSACGRKVLVVDACIALILSQNTSNTNSGRALASLKAAFPGGAEAMLTAGAEAVEPAIRCGGLSNMKAARIVKLLQVNAAMLLCYSKCKLLAALLQLQCI